MTIIQPRKSRVPFFNPLMVVALSAVIGFTGLNILVYNHTVNVRHTISVEQQTLEKARAANAELKNEFYQLLDANNVQALVEERGFVKINTPQYLPS